jgi:hypothetical protein
MRKREGTMDRKSGLMRTVGFLLVLACGLAFWYRGLSERQQQFLKYLVRQAPDLPARYMV